MKIYFMLVVLTFIWGVNVSLVKVLVEHMQPVTITSIRIFTAGLTVFLFSAYQVGFDFLIKRSGNILLADLLRLLFSIIIFYRLAYLIHPQPMQD